LFFPLRIARRIYHYHPQRVFIFVLGLLLGTSNPAKEEEREFLTKTLFIVITLPVAWPLKGASFLPDQVTLL
jgi:hypothetical protein